MTIEILYMFSRCSCNSKCEMALEIPSCADTELLIIFIIVIGPDIKVDSNVTMYLTENLSYEIKIGE